MNKLFAIFAVTFCIILTGCSKESKTDSTEKKPETTTTPVPTTIPDKTQSTTADGTKEEKKTEPEKKESELRDKSGAIRVKFPAGSNEITLNGHIDGFGKNITYVFEVAKDQRLYVALEPPDFSANVRIIQLILPSGKKDGPFGFKIKRPTEESGDYKIVIGEDEMAGKPWKGEYKLTIQIM